MTARKIGLMTGPLAFAFTLATTPPLGMAAPAWLVAGLVLWMAAWWMTEAVPLSVTGLLPFVILPFAGVMDAKATASAYYSPIIFLLLGGAFIALAIERTGLHRRLALFLLVRRQNIWHNSRRRSAECGPRLGLMFRRRACSVASADVRVSFA